MKKLIFILLYIYYIPLIAQENAILINKDANMYKVDDKFYRSEQLREEDKQFVASSNIKTIINLRYFTRDGNKKLFSQKDSLLLINYPLLTWQVKPKQIAKVLHLIKTHQKKGAVLVHCYHGADRTGIMVAMYRIIFQNWTIKQAKDEMQQGPYGYHSIWKNLDNLFNEKSVEEVKTAFNNLKEEENNTK